MNKPPGFTYESVEGIPSGAKLGEEASSIYFDSDRLFFHSTVDKLLFENITDVLTKVLTSNQFKLNLENYLSCLDTLVFGTKVEKTAEESIYFPAIGFQLPRRMQKKGTLINAFYEEISFYENAILEAKLSKNEEEQAPKKLAEENKQLKSRLAKTYEELKQLQELVNRFKSSFGAGGLKTDAGVLPANMKKGIIKDIELETLTLSIGMGRKKAQFPIELLTEVPEVGEPCLVQFESGLPIKVYLLSDQPRYFPSKLGVIRNISGGAVKIRTLDRTYVFLNQTKIQNRFPKGAMRRGAEVVLEYFNGIPFRCLPIGGESDSTLVTKLVHESLIKKYLKGGHHQST